MSPYGCPQRFDVWGGIRILVRHELTHINDFNHGAKSSSGETDACREIRAISRDGTCNLRGFEERRMNLAESALEGEHFTQYGGI